MPTLVLSPNPVAPGANLAVNGSGFDPSRKVELAIANAGWTTNVLRPRKDGTFQVGMIVPTTVGTYAVAARDSSTNKAITSTSVQVAKPAPVPVPVPPDPIPVPPPVIVPAPTGNVRYLSSSGSDSAAGGVLDPWRSLGKFLSSAVPGDTLRCRGGQHLHTSRPRVSARSGLPGKPITIEAYPSEIPEFIGAGTTSISWFLLLEDGASYWNLDGLWMKDFKPGQSGVVWIGDETISTHHNAVRRCHFKATPRGSTDVQLSHSEQQVYLSWNADDSVVEDNVFIGASVDGDGGTAVNCGDHSPGPKRFLIRRNIMDGFGDTGAMWINDAGGGGEILHNTLVNNAANIRLINYSAITVRDNAGTHGRNYQGDIEDRPGRAVADHNVWGVPIVGPGYAPVGPAIGGAHDGSNAGAR